MYAVNDGPGVDEYIVERVTSSTQTACLQGVRTRACMSYGYVVSERVHLYYIRKALNFLVADT